MIEVFIYLAGVLVTFPFGARWVYRTERPQDPISPAGAVALGFFIGILWPAIVVVSMLYSLCKVLSPIATWRNR